MKSQWGVMIVSLVVAAAMIVSAIVLRGSPLRHWVEGAILTFFWAVFFAMTYRDARRGCCWPWRKQKQV